MRTQKLIRVIAFMLVMTLLTTITVAALADYGTIPYGEQSDSVRKMQKALKSKKHYTGSVDGKFGPATKKAVMKFQRSIGLKADGKPGNKTLTALYEGASAINSYRNEDRKTSSDNPRTLYYGCSGSRVKSLQRALKEVDCYSGSIDGKYGDLTYEAVKRFQSKVGLNADGKAGAKTLKSLNNKTKKNKVSTSFVLEVGSASAEVSRIQSYLKGKGYDCGGESYVFGKGTETSVRIWQGDTGKDVTGKITESQYNDIVTAK